MKFEPDIIISWDISPNDLPVITIMQTQYDTTKKHIVGEVLESFVGETDGAISINQIIARHKFLKLLEKVGNEHE